MTVGVLGGRSGVPRWAQRVHGWVGAHWLAVDVVIAVVLAVPLGAWSVLLLFDPASEPGVGGALATRVPWVVSVAVIVGHGALALRRIRPFASFVLVSAAVGVQQLTSVWWFLPSVSLCLLSLYSYCAYGRRAAPTVALVVAVLGVAGVTLVGFPLAGMPSGPWDLVVHGFVRLLPFVVSAWSLGMFRRVRLAYVGALEERAVRAEAEREQRARRAVAEERARIARDMHDIVAHALSVMISQAQGGRYAAGADPGRAVQALATIAGTGRQTLADMRGLLTVLRGAEDGDADPFPQPSLRELPALFDRVRAAGVEVDCTVTGFPLRLGGAAELAVFRLVQEALTNTIKHAGPGAGAEVLLEWDVEGLVVTVRDDGRGQGRAECVVVSAGMGLVGMRERVAVVGGSVSSGWLPNGGYVVRGVVPGHAGSGVSR